MRPRALPSRATRFELAQFIKPRPVHEPRVHTAKTHSQQNSCCTFLDGRARQMSKENQRREDEGESLWGSVCQPQWEAPPSPPQRQAAAGGTRRPVLFAGFSWSLAPPHEGREKQNTNAHTHTQHCCGSRRWQRHLSSPSARCLNRKLSPSGTSTSSRTRKRRRRRRNRNRNCDVFNPPCFLCDMTPNVWQCEATALEAFTRHGLRELLVVF